MTAVFCVLEFVLASSEATAFGVPQTVPPEVPSVAPLGLGQQRGECAVGATGRHSGASVSRVMCLCGSDLRNGVTAMTPMTAVFVFWELPRQERLDTEWVDGSSHALLIRGAPLARASCSSLESKGQPQRA